MKLIAKIDVKKLLYSIKGAVLGMDIENIPDKQLEEVSNNFKNIISKEVTDITHIDGDILDSLQCGDKVIKVTGNQKHCYIVSYKGEGVGQGICLTYHDASLIETVSYDFTADGWAYNSTDKWEKA